MHCAETANLQSWFLERQPPFVTAAIYKKKNMVTKTCGNPLPVNLPKTVLRRFRAAPSFPRFFHHVLQLSKYDDDASLGASFISVDSRYRRWRCCPSGVPNLPNLDCRILTILLPSPPFPGFPTPVLSLLFYYLVCMYVCMYPSGRGQAYSGPIR